MGVDFVLFIPKANSDIILSVNYGLENKLEY